MPSLPEEQRAAAIAILTEVRRQIDEVAGSNPALIFQMRRYIGKRLEFDERGTPTARRKLKDVKWKRQRGLCSMCNAELPERGAELDRLVAMDGYTEANTQLVCHGCHRKAQELRGFA